MVFAKLYHTHVIEEYWKARIGVLEPVHEFEEAFPGCGCRDGAGGRRRGRSLQVVSSPAQRERGPR